MVVNTHPQNGANIKVIGVGGGGSNAVSRMFRERLPGVEYMVVNTDTQALLLSDVPVRIAIGELLTQGKGVGGNPDLGAKSASESREEVHEAIREADMIFIAAGMGGGTGTGAAPVISEIIKETGALTVGVVTMPFMFEGTRRMRTAEEGIKRLQEHVDTLLVIPNERLLATSDEEITTENAFRMADDVLRLGVQSIAELVTVPGEINLDLADIQTVMRNAGPASMSIGRGKGENRAKVAAHQAISNPLLDVSVEGATGVLFNVTGGSDLRLAELQEAAEVIQRVVDPEAEHHLRNGQRPEDGERSQAHRRRNRLPDFREHAAAGRADLGYSQQRSGQRRGAGFRLSALPAAHLQVSRRGGGAVVGPSSFLHLTDRRGE